MTVVLVLVNVVFQMCAFNLPRLSSHLFFYAKFSCYAATERGEGVHICVPSMIVVVRAKARPGAGCTSTWFSKVDNEPTGACCC